jgi:hypothetical protein
MPKGSEWVKFLYVNLAFIFQIFAMYFFIQLKAIKENWPAYRCNPIYMPLASVITDGKDTIAGNFAYCIQNMQASFMGYLLQPLESIMGGLGNVSFGMLDDLTNARNMIGFMRFSIGDIFGNIAGIFSNIVLEFMKIMLRTKDLMGKIIGVVQVFEKVLATSNNTMQSAWNGPPGQMIKVMGAGANLH